ncbi:MAG TPA: hypothetical protein VLJ44_06370 [Gaiellaceae bacterium]|nr:hypothetical protein [Gaiellaceae bacterium]
MTLVVVAIVSAGCGTATTASEPALPPPPSPALWPAYPSFPASCWARPTPGGGAPLRAAPSYLRRSATGASPEQVARRTLQTLGDDRYVQAVEIGPVPRLPLMHLKGWFAGARPPRGAVWAFISDPDSVRPLPAKASPRQRIAVQVATWEAELVKGALRDGVCAAGRAPLVGWTVSGVPGGVSDRAQALGQRFPNPAPNAFLKQLRSVGDRYGFDVVSVRLLRPLQLAPLVVIRTNRDRKAFVHDVPAIMRLLDPVTSASNRIAITFEGFFLSVEDANGPFVSVDDAYRGEVMGGQWSWNGCEYPYLHTEPPGAKPCP